MKPKYAIAILAAILFLTGASFSGEAQDIYRNYIMKTVHTSADSTSTQALRQTAAYYDGLGRPIQTVLRKGSPDGHDLAYRVEYDSLGRVYRIWQTVRSPFSNGYLMELAALSDTARRFYSDESPFKETLYDGSPLDRIRKVTGPGHAWHQANKGVTSGLLTNSESITSDSLHCRKYIFSLSGNTGITFELDNLRPWPAGSLSVSRTEDEDGRVLWVFKDMRDLVVLERRLAAKAQGNSSAIYADTYYLYDDAGRLIAVLPPELSNYFAQGYWSGSSGSDPKVDGFAYQYRYDSRGRMIAKKLPGAAWTYYIYDKSDRLVLTQDGNQRLRNEWSFRLQDALGRECLTGTLTETYNAFSSPLSTTLVAAIRDRSSGIYGALHGYTVSGMTLPSNAEVLTVNFWDDYSFLDHESDMTGTAYNYVPPTSDEIEYGKSYGADAQGLLTGRWCKALGDVPDTWTANAARETWYYDDHGRTVFHVKCYPSGNRMIERMGYSFAGELTNRLRTMQFPGNTGKTEEYTYTYDGWGRLKDTFHSLSGTTIKLASNNYDMVGRLASTSRGGTGNQNGPSALASAYTYNVRDWMTEISGTLFTETLTYETPRTGSSFPGQWGGTISSSTWNTSQAPSDSTWYDYRYDLLGRLTEASYGCDLSDQEDYRRTYSYDLNGNLRTRTTPGFPIPFVEDWPSGTGNQPLSLAETVRNLYGTFPQSILQESYAYDAVGNRTEVLNAQGDTLNMMRYNLLNLPEAFASAQGDTVNYVYSADGEKLYVAENLSGSAARGTEYAANYRIENGTVTMIHTDEGYYTPVALPPGASGPSFTHIWYLKDHLGNNRVLADGSGNAVAFHDYDPYGEEIAVASSSQPYPLPPGAKDSPYLYGGKEWSETTSTYDFEARQFSPAFHRFTTMDPLAEKYYSISPYAYCANNPCVFIDPFGFSYYMVGGVEHRLDDGDDSFRMDVSEREFDRLSKYYTNNSNRYVRYRNHLSRTHEYTTVETEPSSSTDLPGSVITVHRSGESYLDYQSQSYQWIDILNALDVILSQANYDYATERVYYGSNGKLYFQQPSGMHFYGNQYVKVVEFAKQFNTALKTMRISDKILNGINYASIARDVYSVFIYEGGFGINSQLILEAKLAGLLGTAIGGQVGAALGASSGIVTGPGAVLASLGLSIALGAAGGQVEKIADGTIFF